MSARKLAHLILVLLLGIGWLVALVPTDPLNAGGGVRARLRYGFIAQCNQPFYGQGSEAQIQLALFNHSSQNANGYSTQGGGFGCEFSVEILDLDGTVLSAPRVGCLDVIVEKPLPQGSVLRATVIVPLRDFDGFVIPVGHYQFRVSMEFNGPHRQPGTFERGGNAQALIPFAIEP